jgi:hypothetical protein
MAPIVITDTPKTDGPEPVTGVLGTWAIWSHLHVVLSVQLAFRQFPLMQTRFDEQSAFTVQPALHTGTGVGVIHAQFDCDVQFEFRQRLSEHTRFEGHSLFTVQELLQLRIGVGVTVGVGVFVGVPVGVDVGVLVGVPVGVLVGVLVGVDVGVNVGVGESGGIVVVTVVVVGGTVGLIVTLLHHDEFVSIVQCVPFALLHSFRAGGSQTISPEQPPLGALQQTGAPLSPFLHDVSVFGVHVLPEHE